jgi:hypothetical protein
LASPVRIRAVDRDGARYEMTESDCLDGARWQRGRIIPARDCSSPDYPRGLTFGAAKSGCARLLRGQGRRDQRPPEGDARDTWSPCKCPLRGSVSASVHVVPNPLADAQHDQAERPTANEGPKAVHTLLPSHGSWMVQYQPRVDATPAPDRAPWSNIPAIRGRLAGSMPTDVSRNSSSSWRPRQSVSAFPPRSQCDATCARLGAAWKGASGPSDCSGAIRESALF